MELMYYRNGKYTPRTKITSYDSLQDLGQELLPNSSSFEVHRNYIIDSLSYVKFCQEFNFEDKNAQAIFV